MSKISSLFSGITGFVKKRCQRIIRTSILALLEIALLIVIPILMDITPNEPVAPPVSIEAPVSSEYVPKKSDFDFKPYTSVNPDVVGYINIPGTGLDEIVVQSTNGERDYYLHKNWKGEYDRHGTVYFDNSFDLKNPEHKVWLAFGHNNANGTGFPELHKWNPVRHGNAAALAYYKEHHLAQIDTTGEAGEWQIFAAFVSSNTISDGEHFLYYQDFNFDNASDYQDYIDNIRIRSVINTPVTVTTDDRICLLSTCITDGSNYYGNNYKDWRMVLALRKVRPGEEAEFDSGLAEINPNPLMPDKWHKNTGKAKPTAVPGSGRYFNPTESDVGSSE